MIWSTIGFMEEINGRVFCQFIVIPLLRINCRQMKSRGFVWKARLVIYDSAKLNLTLLRISYLWNSCKTSSSSSQEERSEPNYGLNAARIPTVTKLSYLVLLTTFQATTTIKHFNNSVKLLLEVFGRWSWRSFKDIGHSHGRNHYQGHGLVHGQFIAKSAQVHIIVKDDTLVTQTQGWYWSVR